MLYFNRLFILLSLAFSRIYFQVLSWFHPKNIRIMKNPFVLCLTIILASNVYAQVGIGTISPLSTLDVRGSFSGNYRSFTANTTASSTDYALAFTGTTASSLTLPDATTCTGRIYLLKNANTAGVTPLVTVITTSSQTIDGASSYLLDQHDESVMVTSNGTNWNVSAQNASAVLGSVWNLDGNSVASLQTLGPTSNFDLPFITNNIERMRIGNAGNVGIGTSTFNVTNPEKLLVQAGGTTSFNLVQGHGKINNYLQLNVQNDSAGTLSSSDVVATADNGNETVNYVDLGINSSANTQNIMGNANDAYLYSTGNNFLIGNGTVSKALVFMTGGTTQSTNERMRIDGSGNVGIGNIVPTTVLDVNGTVKMRSTVQVGSTGTPLNAIIRFTNQSITDNTNFDFSAPRTETFTLTGVTQYATVIITPRSALPTGMVMAYAYASATNTVKLNLETSSNSTSLGTMIFDITVIQ
jgi:hypothetical protein